MLLNESKTSIKGDIMTKENPTEDENIVPKTEQKESKVKTKFAKVKSWCKEHKGEIIKDALLIGAGAAAVVIAKIATDDGSDNEYLAVIPDDSVEISEIMTDENGQAYYTVTAKSSDDNDSEESEADSTEE